MRLFLTALVLIGGAIGFVMLKLDYSPVPLVLGLVLGPLLERGVRRTLIVSEGNCRSSSSRRSPSRSSC